MQYSYNTLFYTLNIYTLYIVYINVVVLTQQRSQNVPGLLFLALFFCICSLCIARTTPLLKSFIFFKLCWIKCVHMRVCVYASESNALHLVLEQKNKMDFLYFSFVSCKLPTPHHSIHHHQRRRHAFF